MTHFMTSSFVKFVFADSQRCPLLFLVVDYAPGKFTQLLAALDCKPHLNIGCLIHWDAFATFAYSCVSR